MGFMDDLKKQLGDMANEEKENQTSKKDLKKQLDREGKAYCPKCLSTDLTANKKGVGIGKAATGGLIAGPIGLLAGGIGKNKINVTCLKCGHKFKPGR